MAKHIRGPPEPHVRLLALHPLYSIFDLITGTLWS